MHSEIREELEAELQQSRKSNDTEDRFDVLFTDRVGLRFARLFIKIHFTPNMVTLLSMLCGVTGGILFYPQDIRLNLLGILLEILAAVFDCSDGQVARLTNHRSRLGRILDGISDGLCFASIYIFLGFRLMHEVIPFTDGKLWGLWIWPIVLITGGICHSGQCRMADYYRNVHLFFLNNEHGNELSRSAAIFAELKALPGDAGLAERFGLWFYGNYTRLQEKATPKLQKLLEKIEQSGQEVPAELAKAYVKASRQYIRLTKLLTYNVRAYSLFVLILFGKHIYYFPFIVLVMGALNLFMKRKYEAIADTLYGEFCL